MHTLRAQARRFRRLFVRKEGDPCQLGRHTGQADGGTMMFTCPRCGGSHNMRAITVAADMRVEAGDLSAVDWAHEQVRRTVEGA